jgi:hypothetical protein
MTDLLYRMTSTIATSLVPYKNLLLKSCSLYPGCYASSNQIIPGTLNRCKRNHLLSTSSLLAYEASVANSLYSTLQHSSTEIFVPVFLYRSPQLCSSLQHKVICTLPLTIRLGMSILFPLFTSLAGSVRSTST